MSDPLRFPAPVHEVRRSDIRTRTEATCQTRGCRWRVSPADGNSCRDHVAATGHTVTMINKSSSTYHARRELKQ